MAEYEYLKLVYVLLLTVDLVVALEGYTEHHLGKKEICDPLGKKRGTLQLASGPDSAAIVRSVNTFVHWQVITDKVCKFVFKARKGEHLFAVVQNMSLRRNGTECLDYIKFKRKNGQTSRKFCGQIDRRKVTTQPIQEECCDWENEHDTQLYRDSAAFDVEGEIETTIFISKTPLEKDQSLDLAIVYTPYKNCDKIKDNREEYKPTTNHTICLWKNYFCDGYVNCPEEICRDEDNCEQPYDIVSNGTGTKVTIGAVTTMILCFIIFIMGLWICRRNKKLCWSTDCAGPSGQDNRLSRIEREAAGSANQPVVVDRMLQVASAPSVLDKDLPPSYDSLFPEQSNPPAT